MRLVVNFKTIIDRLLGRDQPKLDTPHQHTGGESERPHLGKRGRAHQATAEAKAHVAADRARKEDDR